MISFSPTNEHRAPYEQQEISRERAALQSQRPRLATSFECILARLQEKVLIQNAKRKPSPSHRNTFPGALEPEVAEA
jgi:hypothetical protein